MLSYRSVCLLVVLAACRGEPADAQRDEGAEFARLVDSLAPAVSAAVGLPFKEPPRSALRSRDDVRRFVTVKLADELPPDRVRGIEAAYQLFGMLPDSINIQMVLLDLLTEQIVGYYDPDSAMLYGVAGVPREQLGLMAAHELVHALQGQYLPLDSILSARGSNDRTTAAQSIFEGQAMVASIQVLAGGRDVLAEDAVWDMLRQQAQAAQASSLTFGRAPLVIREALLFPYIEGAEFMRWWKRASGHGDSVPFGPRLPQSTEQILHPDRYSAGDGPVSITIGAMPGAVLHEDVLGEMEMQLLAATLRGASQPSYQPALGWAGDRYRVVASPDGPALVWFVAFDDARGQARFAERIGNRLGSLQRPGYRQQLDPIRLGERNGIRWVMAPTTWAGWGALPETVAGGR